MHLRPAAIESAIRLLEPKTFGEGITGDLEVKDAMEKP
jgi:hypothetical protein